MLAQADRTFVLERAGDDLREFAGARIFVTGGTGFVGKWLVETFLDANRRLALDASLVVLTRDPAAFRAAAPHLASDPALRLIRGDVRNVIAAFGSVDAVVHAATPASAALNAATPGLMLDTIVEGGRSVLAFAQSCGSIPLLLTSSGAVYGRQPADLTHVDETYAGAPDPLRAPNAYHEGKRLAELQCAIAAERGVQAKIARLFAFVGPHLPLDRHFAIGNFVRDALAGRDIAVSGDGSPLRSYLYAADMTVWLWRILTRGRPLRAYNVGSEAALSIASAARRVAAAAPASRVTIARAADASIAPDRYVPSTRRARTELGLDAWTPLDAAIAQTLAWHRRTTAPQSAQKGFVHS